MPPVQRGAFTYNLTQLTGSVMAGPSNSFRDKRSLCCAPTLACPPVRLAPANRPKLTCCGAVHFVCSEPGWGREPQAHSTRRAALSPRSRHNSATRCLCNACPRHAHTAKGASWPWRAHGLDSSLNRSGCMRERHAHPVLTRDRPLQCTWTTRCPRSRSRSNSRSPISRSRASRCGISRSWRRAATRRCHGCATSRKTATISCA